MGSMRMGSMRLATPASAAYPRLDQVLTKFRYDVRVCVVCVRARGRARVRSEVDFVIGFCRWKFITAVPSNLPLITNVCTEFTSDS